MSQGARWGAKFAANYWEQFPELEQMLKRGETRPVRLMCPSCSRQILDVTLDELDYDGHQIPVLSTLAQANGRDEYRDVAFNSLPKSQGMRHPCEEHGCGELIPGEAGWCEAHARRRAVNDVTVGKVKLRCPNKRCRYNGDHRQEELLKLYAVAVRMNLREIHLRA